MRLLDVPVRWLQPRRGKGRVGRLDRLAILQFSNFLSASWPLATGYDEQPKKLQVMSIIKDETEEKIIETVQIMDMTCNCWPFASAIERLPARPPKRDLILKIWDILNVLDLGIPLFAGTMSH